MAAQAVAGRSLFVLDAYEGLVKARHSTGSASGAPAYQASFSPDSSFVTSGELPSPHPAPRNYECPLTVYGFTGPSAAPPPSRRRCRIFSNPKHTETWHRPPEK